MARPMNGVRQVVYLSKNPHKVMQGGQIETSRKAEPLSSNLFMSYCRFLSLAPWNHLLAPEHPAGALTLLSG